MTKLVEDFDEKPKRMHFPTVGGCEIQYHQKDSWNHWNPIEIVRLAGYQMVQDFATIQGMFVFGYESQL